MPPKKKTGSAKSKEKKLRRKQEQAEVRAALATVKAAYEMGDHMTALSPFRRYNRNGLDLTISFHPVSEMSPDDTKWAFDLMKECVKSYYISGGWGWNDRKKWDELTHESACFLLARESHSQKPVGFVNFRFDLDENIEVAYCYEIHLDKDFRRKGVGKFLMQILELIAHRAQMKKVVLTLFKENTSSNDFFRNKLNYVDDETSPLHYDPLNVEDYSYSILSKTLMKKPVKLVAGAAKPVVQAECSSSIAQKAMHQDNSSSTSSKQVSSTSQTSTASSSAEACAKTEVSVSSENIVTAPENKETMTVGPSETAKDEHTPSVLEDDA